MTETCIGEVRELEYAIKAGPFGAPRNDNHASGGRCPNCRRPAPIAPKASEYCGGGIIHHHWHCCACDHAWITALHVPM